MAYLAPELLDGKPADARSDIFSLGVVLHELLAGQRLFVGETDFETLQQVKSLTIPRPSKRNSAVKPALDNVVMRALERDPAKRYQTAGEMGDELEALVLRKNYSTRALARKARELADQEPAYAKARPTPLAGATPPIVGSSDSTVFVDDSMSGRVGSGPTLTAAGPRPGGRWWWLAVGAPCVVAGVLLGALLRPSPPRPVVVAAPPPAVPTPPPAPAPPPADVPPATVRVALDSTPQGATVTGADGPLGKTPLLLQLPRSQDVVQLTLTKPGFQATPVKVIPYQDKDLVAKLKRAAARPAFTAASMAGPGTQTKTVRVTQTTTSRTQQVTTTPAPTPPATRGAPPPFRR
jgi:hypothetical protein